jgi:hypothetical protein
MDGITHIATEATTTATATTGIIIGIGPGSLGHGRIIAIGKRWVCAVRWLRGHHFLKAPLCSIQVSGTYGDLNTLIGEVKKSPGAQIGDGCLV